MAVTLLSQVVSITLGGVFSTRGHGETQVAWLGYATSATRAITAHSGSTHPHQAPVYHYLNHSRTLKVLTYFKKATINKS